MNEIIYSSLASSEDAVSLWIDDSLARADAQKPFLNVDGKTFSYGDLDLKAKKLTRVLTYLCDTQRGVAIMTRSAEEMSCLYIAALRAGIPVIAINPDLTPRERVHALGSSGVTHVFLDADVDADTDLPDGVMKTVIERTDLASSGLVAKLLGGARKSHPRSAYETMIDDADPLTDPPIIHPEQTAMLLMTSGTTSNPKIVEISHKNIAAQLAVFSKVYQLNSESRMLNPLPLHFTDGIFHGPLNVLYAGATLYRPAAFDFEKLDDLVLSVYRDRITHFFIVPTILSLINALPEAFDNAFDTPDFKMIRTAGDRLAVPLWSEFEDRFSVSVSDEYGLSETTCAATYCTPGIGTHKRGTIGKPVGCEVRIVTPDGTDAAPGETGELLISGDVIVKGYRNNPEANEHSFQNGWLKTGDLGKFDEEGFLVITGRASNLIISGGINVSPAEITDVLMHHPDIADTVVFGVDDPTLGQKVVAAVKCTLDPGDQAETEEDILEFCRAKLARHKVPRDLLFVEDIPRTLSGKPIIRQFKDMAQNPTGSAAISAQVSEGEILQMASEVFGCQPSDLSMKSSAKSTAGWDSFAHVQLILEAESRFKAKIPSREFLNIRTLGDLARVLENADGAA